MAEDTVQCKPENEKKVKLSKSWPTYLFEFVSLTLAVFMGFFAENLREEMAERKQAIELAQNLYDELVTDSIAVDQTIRGRQRMNGALLALKDYVRDSSLSKVSKAFIKNFFSGIHYSNRFQPTDVVLEQLKASGSLSYFKSKELQRLIHNLGGAISQVRQRNQIELEFGYTYIIPFNVNHIDQEYLPKITDLRRMPINELLDLIERDSVGTPFEITNLNQFKRKDVINMLLVYRNLVENGASACNYYREANNKLLAELRKEYQIKPGKNK
ncbi:MAG: hypothetical protein KF856_16150 [Cyclobacteriaceae bacterium]|nr:hypothetical protein [Cyclobacteriaceae bacterium]